MRNAAEVLEKVRVIAAESFQTNPTLERRFVLAQTLNDLGLAKHKSAGTTGSPEDLRSALEHAHKLLKADPHNFQYQRLMLAVRSNKGMSDLQLHRDDPMIAAKTYRPAIKLVEEMLGSGNLDANQTLEIEMSYVRLQGNKADAISRTSRRQDEIETREKCLVVTRQLVDKYRKIQNPRLQMQLDYFNSIQGIRLGYAYHLRDQDELAMRTMIEVLKFTNVPENFETNNPRQQYYAAILLALVRDSLKQENEETAETIVLTTRVLQCLNRAKTLKLFESENGRFLKDFCSETVFGTLDKSTEFASFKKALCEKIDPETE